MQAAHADQRQYRESGSTTLFIVYRIRLVERRGKRRAVDGVVQPFVGWNIDDWTVTPAQYRVAPS